MMTWLDQPLFHRLGLVLLHSLWQLTLLALILIPLLAALRRRSPHLRYALAYAALVLMAVAPVLTFVYLTPRAALVPAPVSVVSPLPTPAPAPLVLHHPAVVVAAPAPAPAPPSPIVNRKLKMENVTPALALTWLLGVAFLSLRLLAGQLHLCRLRRTATPISAALQATLARLARHLALSRPVQLLQSALVEVPTALGELRPLILLPAAALTGLPPDHLEALLAHELAHIRRHDYLANLVQTFVETLLFYHPAVWWLSARIRTEREDACDDLAAGACGSPALYAHALAAMESLRPAARRARLSLAQGPALATHSAALLPRIRRLLGLPAPTIRPVRILTISSAVLCLALIGLVLYTASCDKSTPPTPTTGPASAGLELAKPQVVRVYDIRDLLVQPDPTVTRPNLTLGPPDPAATRPARTITRDEIVRTIIDTIQSTVAPDTWRDAGGSIGSIKELNGQLIINQTDQNQIAVYNLIQQLREARAIQISFEARILTLDEPTFKALKFPLNPKDQSLASVLSEEQLAALLKTVQASPASSTVACPRVTLFNGQAGYVAVTNQQAYTPNIHLKAPAPAPAEYVADTATLNTGMALVLEATVSADRRRVVTKVDFTTSHLDGMDHFRSPEIPAHVPSLDLPRVTCTQVQTMVSIPDDSAILLGGQKLAGEVETAPQPAATATTAPRFTPQTFYLILILRPHIIIQDTP